MIRKFVPFDDNYRVPVDVRVSCGVVGETELFICGQMDIDNTGTPRNVGDLWAQTKTAMGLLLNVIEKGGYKPTDLAQLKIFYRPTIDEAEYLSKLTSYFPICSNSSLILIPVKSYPSLGAEVEIDAILSTRSPVPSDSYQGRRGRLSSITNSTRITKNTESIIAQLSDELALLDQFINNVIRLNLYFGADLSHTEMLNFQKDICEAFGPKKPTYHGVQLPCKIANAQQVRLEIIALAGIEREYLSNTSNIPDEPDFSEGIRVHDLICIAGQLAANNDRGGDHIEDLASQTPQVMGLLDSKLQALGANSSHITKINAYWIAEHDLEKWATNVGIRNNYYIKPGPASTGIEVKALTVADDLISVDCFALLGE